MRSPLIEPEQRVGQLNLKFFERFWRRLIFDDNRNVRHRVAKQQGMVFSAPATTARIPRASLPSLGGLVAPLARLVATRAVCPASFSRPLPCRVTEPRQAIARPCSHPTLRLPIDDELKVVAMFGHCAASQSNFGQQMRRPSRIRGSDVRVQREPRGAAQSCSSTITASSDSAMPMRFATHRT